VKSYRIGRSARLADVVVPVDSLSGLHAELVVTDRGRYYLSDCASTNGTFRRRNGRWERLRQEWIEADEPLLLGEYRTSVRGLLGLAGGGRLSDRESRPREQEGGKLMRNPETGEILRADP
jgi:hypothetical protein